MKYFSKHGTVKKTTNNPNDYTPGDIVTWNLGGGITHIGIVVDKKSNDEKRYLLFIILAMDRNYQTVCLLTRLSVIIHFEGRDA